MPRTFSTSSAFLSGPRGEKIIYPFGPPILQTVIPEDLRISLLDTGNLSGDNCEHKLAGNMINGSSISYAQDFIDQKQDIFLNYSKDFLDLLRDIHGPGIVSFDHRDLYLESLWINQSRQGDFNPPHYHNGFLSFVIFLNIPEEIFTKQTKSLVKDAGKLVFEYGENICDFMFSSYKITPFDGLMLLFPSRLRHYVPPFYTDDLRISVSGNFFVKT